MTSDADGAIVRTLQLYTVPTMTNTTEIAIARTPSKDVLSRKSYARDDFDNFDDVATKIEAAPSMRDIVNGAA